MKTVWRCEGDGRMFEYWDKYLVAGGGGVMLKTGFDVLLSV